MNAKVERIGTGIAVAVAVAMAALLAALFAGAAAAPAGGDPVVAVLMQKDLPELPGKEVLVLSVEYPPGGADPVHRHNAHGFVHVLEGSVVMGVRGGQEVTLGPGELFYEGPEDVHTVGRNASNEWPARFLVFLLKDEGADVLIAE